MVLSRRSMRLRFFLPVLRAYDFFARTTPCPRVAYALRCAWRTAVRGPPSRSGPRGERQVYGGEIRDGDQFGEGLQLGARFRLQFADRCVVAEGEVAGG